MIDVHCHLNFHAFKDDAGEVIKEALQNGVTRIINVGTKIDSSEEAVKLATQHKELYAIVGIHPHHADKLEAGWEIELDKLAKNPKTLAIGEIGMDYYSYKSNGIVEPSKQREVFIRQIKIAHENKLPLQIHNRQAGEDVIKILKEYKEFLLSKPGMFHCFAGSKEVLKDALELGFYIGFDGNITYPGLAPGETVSLQELCSLTPLDRIVVETDSPYLTPIPRRGTRNKPANVIITARFIADLKNVTYVKLVAQTTENVYTMFSRMK